jgi:hypothetical protein
MEHINPELYLKRLLAKNVKIGVIDTKAGMIIYQEVENPFLRRVRAAAERSSALDKSDKEGAPA